MSGQHKSRLTAAAKRLARRLAWPVWRHVRHFLDQKISQQIDGKIARHEEWLGRLDDQVTFTLRALAAQVSNQRAPADAAADSRIDKPPVVSILIPTDTRVAAVDNLLHCLQYQDGPDFEVIIIRGPTENGMTEMLSRWQGAVKIAHNPERNISISRNLGAAIAAGNILVMIDDDALPEPGWLASLIKPFENPEVGCTGGADFDYTGLVYWGPFMTMNRLGHVAVADARARNLNFPFSYIMPFARGLNCAYRSEAFFAVGGFDEEYEYHFDEADLCCRVVDAGWNIIHLPDAIVHHKILPSHLRSGNRIIQDWFPTMKGKLYFSIINNKSHYPLSLAIADWHEYLETQKGYLRDMIANGELPDFDFNKMDDEAKRGFAAGLRRGLSGQRRLLPPEARRPAPFLPFPRKLPEGGKTGIIFACFRKADAGMVSNQARRLGQAGHQVNLFLPSNDKDMVDFETALWVHRFRDIPAAIGKIIERMEIALIYLPAGNPAGVKPLTAVLSSHYDVTRSIISRRDRDPFLQDQSADWIKLELAKPLAS